MQGQANQKSSGNTVDSLPCGILWIRKASASRNWRGENQICKPQSIVKKSEQSFQLSSSPLSSHRYLSPSLFNQQAFTRLLLTYKAYHRCLLIKVKNQGCLICSNVDGTGGYYAEWNMSVREGQISYVFIHMWILRNLTEDHGGREGEKTVISREGGRQTIRESQIQRTNWGWMGGWGRRENEW